MAIVTTVSGTFDDRPGEFDRMEELLAQFATANGLPESALYDFNVVLDEVVSNIVKYAYAEGAPKEITVQLTSTDGTVEMSIEDSGRPFDPLGRPEPVFDLPAATRPIGGVGVHLVRRLMDEVAYARIDNHNQLTVRKRLSVQRGT